MTRERYWPTLSGEERWNPEQIKIVAEELKDFHPQEIIRWGVEQLGVSRLVLACSFGY